MTFPRGRFFGVLPCVSGVTSTDKSCHNNVRGGEPSALAIDLHIYGETEERKVEFYKLLRSKVRKSKLKSGGDFGHSNAHWAQYGLGWDPGHVELLNCKSQLRLK